MDGSFTKRLKRREACNGVRLCSIWVGLQVVEQVVEYQDCVRGEHCKDGGWVEEWRWSVDNDNWIVGRRRCIGGEIIG